MGPGASASDCSGANPSSPGGELEANIVSDGGGPRGSVVVGGAARGASATGGGMLSGAASGSSYGKAGGVEVRV